MRNQTCKKISLWRLIWHLLSPAARRKTVIIAVTKIKGKKKRYNPASLSNCSLELLTDCYSACKQPVLKMNYATNFLANSSVAITASFSGKVLRKKQLLIAHTAAWTWSLDIVADVTVRDCQPSEKILRGGRFIRQQEEAEQSEKKMSWGSFKISQFVHTSFFLASISSVCLDSNQCNAPKVMVEKLQAT